MHTACSIIRLINEHFVVASGCQTTTTTIKKDNDNDNNNNN